MCLYSNFFDQVQFITKFTFSDNFKVTKVNKPMAKGCIYYIIHDKMYDLLKYFGIK